MLHTDTSWCFWFIKPIVKTQQLCLTPYLKFNIGSSCAKIGDNEFIVPIRIYICKCHTLTESIYWCMEVIKCIQPPLRIQTPGTMWYKYRNMVLLRFNMVKVRLPYILPHYLTPLYYCKFWSRLRRLNSVNNNTDLLDVRPLIIS
jgi:hypothetical protein